MKRVCVITGASSGIGREMAKWARKYFSFDEMWLIARREERLFVLKNEVEKEGGVLVRVLAMDITKEESIARYKEMIESEECLISLLINNAGRGTYGPFVTTPFDELMNMLSLNVNALVHMTKISLPYMRRGSTLLNVASLAAFMPLGNFALYAASKALVLNFTIALRAELKDKGISVSSLCPGPVKSEFSFVASRGALLEVAGGENTEKVARHALKCASRNKAIIIMKTKWKVMASLSRFFSRNFVASLTAKYYKRKHN